MEPSEGAHPDPMGQASAAAGQKIAEFASVAAMLSQVAVMARARQAAKAADNLAQQGADLAAARAKWAPALDRGWLADASLRDVARAWGAAAPWEGTDEGAQAALEACETRLRELRPYAMRRYKELRDQGWGRTHAMADAAPRFAMPPSATPRPAPQDASRGLYDPLPAGSGDGESWVMPHPDEVAAQRVVGILTRLNEQEIAAGRGPLSPAAAEIRLRTRINAPDAVIGAVIDGVRAGTLAMPAVTTPPARRTVSGSGPAALDWPADARAAVTAGAGAGGQPRRAPRPAPGQQPRLHP